MIVQPVSFTNDYAIKSGRNHPEKSEGAMKFFVEANCSILMITKLWTGAEGKTSLSQNL